jgi:hypothetical protein
MRVVAPIIFCGGVLLASSGVQALSEMTSERLLGFCQSQNTADHSLCFGYIMGVFDSEEMRYRACPPGGTRNDAKVEVTIQYLMGHRNLEGSWLAPLSISKAAQLTYPCKADLKP